MAGAQGVLFDHRFLEKHAGAIISDTSVAIVELVANCWDSYASEVSIRWPDREHGATFEIADNGKGMTRAMFERRWRKLDYNRLVEEGDSVEPPAELEQFGARRAYGRNGRGRHAAFRFSDPYQVRTWRDGTEVTFEVRRGTTQPFDVKLLSTRHDVVGHGTVISGSAFERVTLAADEARQVIGSRFLADPHFKVSLDGALVTFDDVPNFRLREIDVEVPGFGTANLTVVDAMRSDRTTQQHGIAWWVHTRLVGTPSWVSFDEKILDGRTREAKRYQIIVRADFLDAAVLADWSGFDPKSDAWNATREAVHHAVQQFLLSVTEGRRRETKAAVYDRLSSTVRNLPPVGRDRWTEFVDKVVDDCPTISEDQIQQVAGILAKLELAHSKFGLVDRLHDMKPGDFDDLNQLLIDWNIRTAKLALDEIQSRLKLVAELDEKLRNEAMEEVGDLQPLFDRSLWIFGPEFESLEFTSNKGMTEVIGKLFGSKERGSLLRPDYVMVPDGSVGLYSRDRYDSNHEVDGVARLVIAEIKRVGVTIGSEQKDQAWKYVKELVAKGLVTEATLTTCFVLGSRVDPAEASATKHMNDRVVIQPMAYETFIRRASARMMGLRDKLRDAPFLKEHGVDGVAFSEPAEPELALTGAV